MPKTRPSQKKAVETHVKKYGYVNYMRRVKPEWKEQLDILLEKLRREYKKRRV
jgi:hypothetical protein